MSSETDTLTQLLPDFETEQMAFERQSQMIRALKGDDPAVKSLADQLKRCAKGRPCDLSMCPICVRRLRASFVLAALKVIKRVRQRRQLPITAFSAVSRNGRYPVGKIAKIDLPVINKRVQRQHQRAQFPLVFAGIDLSLNEDGQRKRRSHWRAQVYGVVIGLDVEAVKKALQHLYPHTSSTPRPLRVRVCSELPEALSYVIKPEFVRRVSYIDDTNRHNTRKCGLKAAQLRELALCLGRYESTVRYALTGCRRYSDRIDLYPGARTRLKELALAQNTGPN
jgi:hypothetical protein